MDTIQQVQQTLQAGQQPPITTTTTTTLPPKQPITVTTAQSDMSRATGGGQAIIEEFTLERRREEIVSEGGGGYRSLDELDRERERKRQELYLEEKQREKGGAGALGADRIEVIDEKDLKTTGVMAHPARATATGLRSLLPTWSSTTGAAARPASEADQRLQHAAKEMSEALVLKAGELKDSAVHMTSSLGKKYSTYLPGTPARPPARPADSECPVCSPPVDEVVPHPSCCVCVCAARFSKAYGAGMTEWERYGRKMDDANRLLVKAERISNEAKNAPPSRCAASSPPTTHHPPSPPASGKSSDECDTHHTGGGGLMA